MAAKKAKKRAPPVTAPASGRAPRRGPARTASMQETREALLAAGLAAFAEEGLDAPSLDAICARAGFTRGAFYVHFPDRDAFLVAVMQKATGGFLNAVVGPPEAAFDLELAIRTFAEAVAHGSLPVGSLVRPHQFAAACARSAVLRAGYEAVVEEAKTRVERAVRRAQAAGAVRADVDAASVAGLLIAIVMGVETMHDVRIPFDPSSFATTLLELLRAPRPSPPTPPA